MNSLIKPDNSKYLAKYGLIFKLNTYFDIKAVGYV